MINVDSRLIRELDGDQLKLLTLMADYSNKEMTCWPSVKTLALDCGWSSDKVHRIKRQLITRKLIRSDARYKEKDPGQTSNLYTIITTQVQKYTPPANLIGGGMQGCTPRGGNSAEGAPIISAIHPPANLSDEVLGIEALDNEALKAEALEKEKEYLSFQISNVFQELIETFFTQFDDYKFYAAHERCIDGYDKPIDETSLAFLKKINWAAEKIYYALKTLKRQRLQVGDENISRGEGVSDNVFKEVRIQVNAYHDYCRLTKTFMTTDPEKLPEKLIQADWPFKLFDFVKKDIKDEKYDPAYDKDLLSEWLVQMYYWHAYIDTWHCKRYNNRIVSDGEEYLKTK